MKKVSIVGLGWLGMPLALALALNARGYRVTGTKTTADGVEAARMSGIACYALHLTPELVCDTDDLDSVLNVDALVITLPASRTAQGGGELSAGRSTIGEQRVGARRSAHPVYQFDFGVWKRRRDDA